MFSQKERERDMYKKIEKKKHRKRDRQTEREKDRQTEREKDRQTERERERERECPFVIPQIVRAQLEMWLEILIITYYTLIIIPLLYNF